MANTRDKLKSIRSAIRATQRNSMDIEQIKTDLLDWLHQIKFPSYPNASDWIDCVAVYPDKDPEAPPPTKGVKLRLSLKLFTSRHRYLLSVIECFNPDSTKIGILTVHMNWDEKEYNIQKAIETSYKQQFQDSIRAKQTIWAQSFYFDEIHDALNSCALAILSNELQGTSSKVDRETVKHTHPLKASFPENK